jgi:hypothetical protein
MKRSVLVLRIIALALAATGLWLLLQSVPLGEQSANETLIRAGGGMDTARFLVLVEGWISAYRVLGAILLAVGLWRASESLIRVA